MATLRRQSPAVRDKVTAAPAAMAETESKIKLLQVSIANLTAELIKAKMSLEEALAAQADMVSGLTVRDVTLATLRRKSLQPVANGGKYLRLTLRPMVKGQ